MSAQQESGAKGPPYMPSVAFTGGVPTLETDVPICIILLLFYAGAAVGHNVIFRRNRSKGHKFYPSIVLFGFCMSRIMTCALRMAWATHPDNVSLIIAANILVQAGILIVWVVNIIFTQRIIRAVQPKLGWHPIASLVPKILYVLAGASLILVVCWTIISYYILTPSVQTTTVAVQRAATTYLLVFTLIPVVSLPVTFFRGESAETFGRGSIGEKMVIVWVSSHVCLLEIIFRTATSWGPARPVDNPAWYQSKAWFYTFEFGVLEIIVIYWLLLTRVDQRFHVPDGSSKRKHYRDPRETSEIGPEVTQVQHRDRKSWIGAGTAEPGTAEPFQSTTYLQPQYSIPDMRQWGQNASLLRPQYSYADVKRWEASKHRSV
uniref:Integral membrane protein n=1 Tax=Ramularia collo-cygni TaxID=112498 RepID=A0A2D3VQY7_9PEZI